MSCWDDRWSDIAAFAGHLLARKEAAYPAAIESGRLDPSEAEADLAAWRAIAADWRFAADLAGDPGDDVPAIAKRAAIATALERARAAARRTADPAQRQSVEILEAMAAWQARPCGHVWCAETTLALRAARLRMAA